MIGYLRGQILDCSEGDAFEPARIGLAIVREPVVVDPRYRAREIFVLDKRQAEEWAGAEKHRAINSLEIHVFEACRRIVGARQTLLIPGGSEMLGDFIVALAAGPGKEPLHRGDRFTITK